MVLWFEWLLIVILWVLGAMCGVFAVYIFTRRKEPFDYFMIGSMILMAALALRETLWLTQITLNGG